MNIRILTITNSFVLFLVMLSIAGYSIAETGPQGSFFQPALKIDSKINAHIGQQILKPAPLSLAKTRKPKLKCNFSCSAYIPRQSILELVWEIQPSRNKASVSIDRRDFRLDVSATSKGFVRENFSTIKFSQIPKKLQQRPLNTTSRAAVSRSASGNSRQVLFRKVRSGKITKRNDDLPVFRSIYELNQSMIKSTLSGKVRKAMLDDQLTGSIGQVRVMSVSTVTRKDKLQQNSVAMQGLQPALNYRFRVVEITNGSATTVEELACFSPTCPADFIQTQ